MPGKKKFDPSIYFVLDPSACAGRDPLDVARAAIRGGITMLQYRDKESDELVRIDLAKQLQAITGGSRIAFVINDDVELARMIRADGVHLGQGDMPPAKAREVLGPQAIIGVTAFDPAHFAALDPAVVDYAGTGPFYPTKTDKGKPVLGAEKFARLVELSPVPVVGIGGITPENMGDVIKAGAEGVAMMRAISEAPDTEAAARLFAVRLAVRGLAMAELRR